VSQHVGIAVAGVRGATGKFATAEPECRDIMCSMSDGMLWHRLVQ